MRKNNKRMLVAMLAMAMVLSMTACAEEPAEDTSSSEPESSVSEQVSEPETSDLEVEDDISNSTESETETSDPAAGNTSSSAADAGSSTASQPAADTTTSQPAADQGSSQAQQPAASGQGQTSSQSQTQGQSTSTPPATQASNTSSGKGPLANYTVSVQDNSTPAVSVSGRSIDGKSGYYFYSADDDILGYIASNVVSQINRDYKMIQKTDEEHKAWYVEQFNVLRGVEGSSGSTGSGSSGSSSGSTGSSSSKLDIDEYCEEVIHLANIEREAAGLDPLVMDETAMEYAQIRAKELASSFSHIRPDNKASSMDGLEFVENGAKGSKTPEQVVNTWMNSSGHKATLLTDYSAYGNRTGVGVYQTDNGTIYWVQVFVYWDANA